MPVYCTNLKEIMEKYLRVNFFGIGPSSYKKRIYRAAVSQRLRNTAVECLYATAKHCININYVIQIYGNQTQSDIPIS